MRANTQGAVLGRRSVVAVMALSLSVASGVSAQSLDMDPDFERIPDPAPLSERRAAIPGIVEHGLVLASMVERVVVAGVDGVRKLVR